MEWGRRVTTLRVVMAMSPEEKRAKRAEYARAWRAANPDKVRANKERDRERDNERKRAKRAADPEAARARDRARYERQRAREIEVARAWRAANPDKVREYAQRDNERKRAKRAADPEHVRAADRASYSSRAVIVIAQQRARRERDPESRQKQRTYARKHRERDPASYREKVRSRRRRRLHADRLRERLWRARTGYVEKQRARYATDPVFRAVTLSRARDSRLWRKYRLTPTQLAQLSAAQGDTCAICRRHFDDAKLRCVDHDHATGAVRGVLCNLCNTAIGLLIDNTEVMHAAARYVEQCGTPDARTLGAPEAMPERPSYAGMEPAKRRAVQKVLRRERVLRRCYGISGAQYEQLLVAQRGACATCTRAFTDGNSRHIDHDHHTGKVRGILCPGCNKAIGLFGDDVDRLLRAAAYVESKGTDAARELTARQLLTSGA